MPPLHIFETWNERKITGDKKPRVRWFFICEGSQTEKKYFEQLFINLDKQKLPAYAEAKYVRRTDDDETASNPKNLLEYADEIYEDCDGKYGFDASTDSIVIVFDIDIYKKSPQDYAQYLSNLREKGYIPAITNPSFALYLLLHQENAYENLIAPYQKELLENKKVSNSRTFVDKHFSDNYGINPKTGSGIASLSDFYLIAQKEEQNLNNDPDQALCDLSSNIGVVLESFLSIE